MYLQAGGHVEDNDQTLLAAARREFAEETGLTDVIPFPFDRAHSEVPFDIDIHIYPDRPEKQEPAHLHFDFRYLFILTDDQTTKRQKEEINNIIWEPIETFEQKAPSLIRASKKIRDLCSYNKKGSSS